MFKNICWITMWICHIQVTGVLPVEFSMYFFCVAVICNYLMHFSDKIFCCNFSCQFWMFFILYLSIVLFFSQDMDMGISCTCWKCGRTWICIITSVSLSWLAYGENITSLKQKVFLCWMFFLTHTFFLFFSPCVCVRACARVLFNGVCVYSV